MTMTFFVESSNGQVKVLTVCEVLGNVADYADTGVAVVGRMERSVGLIDQAEFLSQDRCERPVITHGQRVAGQNSDLGLGRGDAETTERQAEAGTFSRRSEAIDRPQDHGSGFSSRTTSR